MYNFYKLENQYLAKLKTSWTLLEKPPCKLYKDSLGSLGCLKDISKLFSWIFTAIHRWMAKWHLDSQPSIETVSSEIYLFLYMYIFYTWLSFLSFFLKTWYFLCCPPLALFTHTLYGHTAQHTEIDQIFS